MAEKPSEAAAPAAASASQVGASGRPQAAADAHELGERLRDLRSRVDELRGRL